MSSRSGTKDIENGAILQLYDVKKRIGKGAYGIVWKAMNRSSCQPVALKKIFDAFQSKEDAQRTYREVTYLKAFKGHPNIIQLQNVHRATNNMDLYLVFEYMDIDLHEYLKLGNRMKDNQIKYIVYQILKALKFIHSGNVVHRDLKPSNILLTGDCGCKLADFGLARSLNDTGSLGGSLTDYVATRWYRAPEILLAAKRYTKVVDIWSLGCVLCEMVTGDPAFPGKSTSHQLDLITGVIPWTSPDTDETMDCLGCCQLRTVHKRYNCLKDMLAGAAVECIDLASRMLMMNPLRRMTAVDALAHPYLFKYRRPRDEPILSRDVISRFPDSRQLTVSDYRNTLYSYEGRVTRQLILPLSNSLKTVQYRRTVRFNKSFTDPETTNVTRFKGRTNLYEPIKYSQLSGLMPCNRGIIPSKFNVRY